MDNVKNQEWGGQGSAFMWKISGGRGVMIHETSDWAGMFEHHRESFRT
jgi:hypothetical protein